MAPFESTDHGFINSSDDIEEGTTNQFFTQARAHASFSVSNRPTNILGDQVFDGQTFTNGGLHFASGTITYIPPNLINLAAYATLANPAFTGTPTVGGTAIKVNVGDGALTEKNFTSALNTKLGGIAENADVTPSLAAYATLASPSFTGTVTAGSLCTTGQYAISNNRFTVDTTGHIRIRNSGGTQVAEWDSGNGNIVVTGLYYVSQHFYSDDRIKSNTRDISNATTTLMKVKPVQYEKHPNLIVPEGVENTDLSGIEHFTETGFVAQEIEKIPELAYMVEDIKYSKDKLKGIKTNDLIPYLVKALQEQQARIQTLENLLNI